MKHPISLEHFEQHDGPTPRWQLGQAVALRTYAALLRRHPTRDLRFAVLQPGGGSYRCLALMQGRFEHTVSILNLNGSSLELQRAPGGRGHTLRWPRLLDAEVDPVRVFEETLGWHSTEERSRPSALSLAVLGELATRLALGERSLSLYSGWVDSSGMEGSGIAAWAKTHPDLAHLLPPRGSEWRLEAAASSRLLGLGERHEARPRLVVNLASGEVSQVDGSSRWSLPNEYQKGASVRALTSRLEDEWRG